MQALLEVALLYDDPQMLIGVCSLQTRVKILRRIASDLAANEQLIMERNMRDVASAERKKLDPTLLQRLKLKPEKIRTLVKGIQAIADQEEPLRKVWHAQFFLQQAPLRQGWLAARVVPLDGGSAVTCSAWLKMLLCPLLTALSAMAILMPYPIDTLRRILEEAEPFCWRPSLGRLPVTSC